jgi:hypothetical protein
MTTPLEKIVIVFGLLSCRSSAAAISQFARAVAPHKVLVHHDFSQTPECSVDGENVIVVSNPVETAWGNWSLVSATFTLLEQAVALGKWDYFQLVSESCLPARSVTAFEDYLRAQRPDIMMDLQPLRAGHPVTVMNYGWRYLPRTARLTRIARKAGVWWIGKYYTVQTRCGGHVNVPDVRKATLTERAMRLLGRVVSAAFMTRSIGAFPLGDVKECWVGGQWFGASRPAAERLLAQRACTPLLEAHFRRCHIPDESYLQTLVAHSGYARVLPGNHITFWDGGKFGPDQITVADIPRMLDSGKFFARKFSLDPRCPARQELLAGQDNRAPGMADINAHCQVSDV